MPVTIYRRVLTHVLFDLHFSCDASPSPASPKATRQKKSRETVPSQLQSVPSLLRVQTHLHVQSGYKLHKAGDPHFLLPSLQPFSRLLLQFQRQTYSEGLLREPLTVGCGCGSPRKACTWGS